MDEEELIIPADQLKALITGIHDAQTPGFVAFDAKGTAFLRMAFQRLDSRNATPEKKRQPRGPNLTLTKDDAERVRKIAKAHPNWTKDQVSIEAGLNRKTVRNRSDEFWIEDWGVARTLSQIVDIARLESYRHSGETWTPADVAQMGISNRYRRKSN